jgi:hypothetical protein
MLCGLFLQSLGEIEHEKNPAIVRADCKHLARETTSVKIRTKSSQLRSKLLAGYPKIYSDWQATTNLLAASDMSKTTSILSSSSREMRPVLESMVLLLRCQSDSRKLLGNVEYTK